MNLFAVSVEFILAAFPHLTCGDLDRKRGLAITQFRPESFPDSLVLLTLASQLPFAINVLHIRHSQSLGSTGDLIILEVDRHHHVVVE
ncbi:hypothetical protein D3C85_1245890 [compost metagenome]